MIWKTAILFLLLFSFVICLTADFQSAGDGNDQVGFPFTFYTYLGGKRFIEPPTRYVWKLAYLLMDVLLFLGLSGSLSYLITKWKSKS